MECLFLQSSEAGHADNISCALEPGECSQGLSAENVGLGEDSGVGSLFLPGSLQDFTTYGLNCKLSTQLGNSGPIISGHLPIIIVIRTMQWNGKQNMNGAISSDRREPFP